MGKIFDIDSPIMRALTRMADVMWLNILVLIFAIPLIAEQIFFLAPVLFGEAMLEVNIVLWAWLLGIICSIPLGPALTAMHFVLLKMVRDEDSYVTKTFFKSLKENFKQSVILQIIQFFVGGILLLDFMIMKDMGGYYRYVIMGVALILYMTSLYIYPLQSKFENKITRTIKNSFLVMIMALPKSILMVLVSIIPVIVMYFFDLKAVPIFILFGIAGPGFLMALLYNGTFKRLEPKEEEISEEEELDAAIKKIDEDL